MTTTITELLPCPFCGAVPVFIDRGVNNGIYHKPEDYAWDIQCQTVGCYAECGSEFWQPQEQLAEMWNKRVFWTYDDAQEATR